MTRPDLEAIAARAEAAADCQSVRTDIPALLAYIKAIEGERDEALELAAMGRRDADYYAGEAKAAIARAEKAEAALLLHNNAVDQFWNDLDTQKLDSAALPQEPDNG